MVKKANSKIISKDMAQKILTEVPQYRAFYFFEDIDKYSGTYANSLIVFSNVLTKIDKKSLNFHLKRKDFENWIRTTIGDTQLANQIKKIDEAIEEDELLTKVCQLVENRLIELKKLLALEEPYIEHDDDL
ncbi:MAG: DUF5752 family protein [Candidatus Bathyarchaeota archaeon]|jgi:hypothetical protein